MDKDKNILNESNSSLCKKVSKAKSIIWYQRTLCQYQTIINLPASSPTLPYCLTSWPFYSSFYSFYLFSRATLHPFVRPVWINLANAQRRCCCSSMRPCFDCICHAHLRHTTQPIDAHVFGCMPSSSLISCFSPFPFAALCAFVFPRKMQPAADRHFAHPFGLSSLFRCCQRSLCCCCCSVSVSVYVSVSLCALQQLEQLQPHGMLSLLW